MSFRVAVMGMAAVFATAGGSAAVKADEGTTAPTAAPPGASHRAVDPFDLDGAGDAPAATPVSRSDAVAEPRESATDDGSEHATAEKPAASGFATVRFKNGVPKFQLLEARFVMDGKELPVLTGTPTGGEAMIFDGKVRSGRHVVSTHVVYQGEKRGPFTYMTGYKLIVESEQVLTVPEGRAVDFTIATQKNKRVDQPIEKQLAITVQDNAPAAAAR